LTESASPNLVVNREPECPRSPVQHQALAVQAWSGLAAPAVLVQHFPVMITAGLRFKRASAAAAFVAFSVPAIS